MVQDFDGFFGELTFFTGGHSTVRQFPQNLPRDVVMCSLVGSMDEYVVQVTVTVHGQVVGKDGRLLCNAPTHPPLPPTFFFFLFFSRMHRGMSGGADLPLV